METMNALSESLSTEADIMFIQCLKTLQKIEDGTAMVIVMMMIIITVMVMLMMVMMIMMAYVLKMILFPQVADALDALGPHRVGNPQVA